MCTIHAGCVVALRCHILQTVIEPWHARVRLWSDWWSTVLTYSPWVDSTSPSILNLIIFGKTLQLVSWCDARLRLAVSIVCMEDLLRLRAVGIWVEICLSQATSSDCRQRWWMWYFLNYWHIIDITTWYVISCMMYDVQHLCGTTLVGPNFKNPLTPLFIEGPDPDPNRERRWKELFSTVDVNGNGAVEILRLQFLKSWWNVRSIAPEQRRFLSSHIGIGSEDIEASKVARLSEDEGMEGCAWERR